MQWQHSLTAFSSISPPAERRKTGKVNSFRYRHEQLSARCTIRSGPTSVVSCNNGAFNTCFIRQKFTICIVISEPRNHSLFCDIIVTAPKAHKRCILHHLQHLRHMVITTQSTTSSTYVHQYAGKRCTLHHSPCLQQMAIMTSQAIANPYPTLSTTPLTYGDRLMKHRTRTAVLYTIELQPTTFIRPWKTSSWQGRERWVERSCDKAGKIDSY